MKPANQNSDNTESPNEPDKPEESDKNRVIDILNTQLRALKREIVHKTTSLPFYDFEKYIHTEKVYDFSVTSQVNKKIKYNSTVPKRIMDELGDIDMIIRYNKPHSVPVMLDHIKHACTAIDYELCVSELYDYYISSMYLPLLYILRGTKRIIRTDEWLYAYEERRIVAILRKIDSLRKRNKLPFGTIDNENIETVDTKPSVAKIFAHECKKVFADNLLQINTDTRFIFNKNLRESNDEPPTKSEPSKNYKSIFILMYNNKSHMRYNIAPPKRNAQHTSHSTTLRKIAPDFLKINDAKSLVEYKNKIKQMAFGTHYRKDARDGGRGGVYGNQMFTDQRYDNRNR